jgi:hypothetical protein
MPTATLSYDLTDPDDERAHRYALAGRDALIALEEIEQHCRRRLKYAEPGDEARQELEAVRALVPAELTALLE